jgi:hypothetical protein
MERSRKMASDLYKDMNTDNRGIGNLYEAMNRLKSQGGDPDQMIQQMLNNGRVTQAQVNAATQKARQLIQMFTPGAHR